MLLDYRRSTACQDLWRTLSLIPKFVTLSFWNSVYSHFFFLSRPRKWKIHIIINNIFLSTFPRKTTNSSVLNNQSLWRVHIGFTAIGAGVPCYVSLTTPPPLLLSLSSCPRVVNTLEYHPTFTNLTICKDSTCDRSGFYHSFLLWGEFHAVLLLCMSLLMYYNIYRCPHFIPLF